MIVLASTPRTERGAGRVPVPGGVGTRRTGPPRPPERHGWPFLSRGAGPQGGPRPAAEPDPPAAAAVPADPAVPVFSRAPAPVRHVP